MSQAPFFLQNVFFLEAYSISAFQPVKNRHLTLFPKRVTSWPLRPLFPQCLKIPGQTRNAAAHNRRISNSEEGYSFYPFLELLLPAELSLELAFELPALDRLEPECVELRFSNERSDFRSSSESRRKERLWRLTRVSKFELIEDFLEDIKI